MIGKRYTTQFSVKEMVWYNESAELQDTIIFNGHIQQASAEVIASLGLSFTKSFTLWCSPEVPLREGNRINDGTNDYIIRGIKEFNIGNNKHKQLFVERTEEFND